MKGWIPGSLDHSGVLGPVGRAAVIVSADELGSEAALARLGEQRPGATLRPTLPLGPVLGIRPFYAEPQVCRHPLHHPMKRLRLGTRQLDVRDSPLVVKPPVVDASVAVASFSSAIRLGLSAALRVDGSRCCAGVPNLAGSPVLILIRLHAFIVRGAQSSHLFSPLDRLG